MSRGVAKSLTRSGVAARVTKRISYPPQPERYHDFADQRTVLGVPHALNVVSNLGFLIVGLRRLSKSGASFADARERWP